jgi:hypothetical protein
MLFVLSVLVTVTDSLQVLPPTRTTTKQPPRGFSRSALSATRELPTSPSPVFRSDVPREEDTTTNPNGKQDKSNATNKKNPLLDFFIDNQRHGRRRGGGLARFLPPPPEDQFIMTGDVCVLFFYAFTSHCLNDAIVNSVLHQSDMTMVQAVHSLDPTGEFVNLQQPVWVQTQNQLVVDHVLSVNAQESLLNHWGPLFSTEGSASVALCTCWLLAGYIHRAFLFSNSVDCSADKVLYKTLETWLSTALMMFVLAAGANAVVEQIPILQTLLCVKCTTSIANQVPPADVASMMTDLIGGQWTPPPQVKPEPTSFLSFTKADMMFIVDSMSVLVAWRFTAHRLLNTFFR